MQHHESQGLKCRLLAPINGATARIWSEVEFESLGAMEEYHDSFFKSDAWLKDLRKDMDGLFVRSATTRHQFRVVE